MSKIKGALLLFGGILGCYCGCQRNTEVIATVYNKTLTAGELADMLPVFDTLADSLSVRQQYVDAWILEQVMLHQAKKTLSKEEKNFDKEIEAYKNSLLIYAYKNKMIEQKVNKNVTNDEILAYYNDHKESFRLKEAIVKIHYAKLFLHAPHFQTIKKIIFKSSLSAQEQMELTDLCSKYAVNYYLSNDWLLLSDILKEVPLQNFDETDFKRNHTQFELADTTYSYLVQVLDFKINEGYIPIQLAKQRIIEQILQQRYIKIVEELEKQNLQKAFKDEKIIF
ncbi:MAG: hypothetical protein LBR36_08450 [Bacteroidales bacterium]|nr:hypothetical protein [Bacteroidales bacterium]